MNMKDKNGITLIALVITIIVLLILAGISISMLSGDNSILSKAGEARDLTEIGSIEEASEIIRGEYMVDNNGQQPTSRYIIEKLIQQEYISSSNVEDYGDETGIGKLNIKEKQIDILGSLNKDYYIGIDEANECYLLKKTDNSNLCTIFETAYLVKNNVKININGSIREIPFSENEWYPCIFPENLLDNNLITYDEECILIFVKDGIEYSKTIKVSRYVAVNSNASLELKDRSTTAGYSYISVTYESAYVIKNGERVNISSYIGSGPSYRIDGVDLDSSSISIGSLITNGIVIKGETYEFILVKDGVEYKIKTVAKMPMPV